MAQVTFTRWCIDPAGRTPVSVEPKKVDSVEHYGDAFAGPMGEFPAASRIIMGKREYVVEGDVALVVSLLNAEVQDG